MLIVVSNDNAGVFPGNSHPCVGETAVSVLVKFKIGQLLRFLSHAETVRVFQRACVRARFKIVYSQGFNPHPRLSLVLPRPVGIESDDELLLLQIQNPDFSFDTERFKGELCEQLPQGCEVIEISVLESGTRFRADQAAYIFQLQREYINEDLTTRINRLLESKNLNIERSSNTKKSKIKNIDVRQFIKTIKLDQNSIVVECQISPAGSIRVDEILELLGLDYGCLAMPIRRTNVKWLSDRN